MSKTKITKTFKIDGALTDPTAIVMSSPDSSCGVRRKDTGATVVADGTAMDKISTGIYSIEFTDPAYDLTYQYWIEIDYLGDIYRFEGEIDGSSSPISADLTLQEMIGMFRMMVDDTDKNEFPGELITQILNNNQNRVLSILKRNVLCELDGEVLSQDLDSDGAFDLSGLATAIYQNDKGIDLLQLTGGKPCDKISLDEYREFVRAGKTFTSDKPIYYMRGSKAYIKPISTKIDLYYCKSPTKIVLNVDPSSNVNCELSYDVQMIILGLSVQNYVDKFPECARAYNEAMISIGQLNKKPLSDSIKFARYYGKLPMSAGKKFNIYSFE